jgi:hypothetical protein
MPAPRSTRAAGPTCLIYGSANHRRGLLECHDLVLVMDWTIWHSPRSARQNTWAKSAGSQSFV